MYYGRLIMKKAILSVLACSLLIVLCACGGLKNEEQPIAGADWRTYKGYGITERVINGVAEKIYIESFSASGVVRLLADADDYTIIQELTLEHGKIYDQGYLETSVVFKDVNGDEIPDVVITDLQDGTPVEEIFVYDADNNLYVFSK